MKRPMSLASGFFLLLLTGCTSEPVHPSPTADQVMAEQYRARTEHGAISGTEASAIADAYHQTIGKSPQHATSSQVLDRPSIETNP